jgi:hypothetical protein
MTYRNISRFAVVRTPWLRALFALTRRNGISLMLAALWLCTSATPSDAQQYTVTDLGTLPGNSVSQASPLNDAGEAAGVSVTSTAAIATMFSGGNETSISTLGSRAFPRQFDQ